MGAALVVAAACACGPAPANDPSAPEESAAPPAPVVAPVPRELPDVVARVNDEAIEKWEIEAALREITLASMHPVPQAERAELVRLVLDRVIGHHLAAQVARNRKIAVSDAELDEDLRQMRGRYASDRAFDDTLAGFGVSRDQLRHQRRLSLDMAKLLEVAVAPNIKVSERDVEAYYRENRERFNVPETVTASHILIRVNPDATPGMKSEAQRRAAELLDQIRGGADFAKLAQAHSEDNGTAAAGGLLGRVPPRPHGSGVRSRRLLDEAWRDQRPRGDLIRLPHHQRRRASGGAHAAARRSPVGCQESADRTRSAGRAHEAH